MSNEAVVEDIKQALIQEFCCYGYHNIKSDHKDMNYIINHKKLYRLMDENKLLLGKVIRIAGKLPLVKQRTIEASYLMEYLYLNIKFVWVHVEKRNFYLITVLDVLTCYIVEQLFAASIRKEFVINVFR